MKEKLINDIARKMLPYLDNAQLAKLEEVLKHSLYGFEILLSDEKMDNKADTINNSNMLAMFLSAKRVACRRMQ